MRTSRRRPVGEEQFAKQLTIVACALVLVGFSGCSSSTGSDALIQDQIKAMNELADAMEAKTFDVEKLKQLKTRGEELKKKFDELKLSEADQKALEGKHKAAVEKAKERIKEATMKAMANPDFLKAMMK